MKKFTVKPRTFLTREINIGVQNISNPDRVLIGKLAEVGSVSLIFHEISSEHVIAIFGKRGSGKSYTLGSIIEGLCTKNKESSISKISKKKSVILFDTLGIYQWMNVPIRESSSSDVIKSQLIAQKKWGLHPEPLDVIIFEPKLQKRLLFDTNLEFTLRTSNLTSSDWSYILGLDLYADRMGQLLNDVYIKITQEGYSNGNRDFSPIQNYSIDDILNCLKNDPEIKKTYHSETIRSLIQQFMSFSKNPVFQAEGTDIEDILKPGFLSVILMHKVPDDLRVIIVSSLIKKIIEKRIISSEIEKSKLILPEFEMPSDVALIPPCWIVIDEAQNILPSEKKNPAGELLVKLVREGRNFGISFMFTTQQPSAIDSRILAQIDTMIIHRLTVQQDIEYIRKNIKSALPNEIRYSGKELSFDECLRLLDVGQALVSNTEIERAFFMDVRPRVSVHGGF